MALKNLNLTPVQKELNKFEEEDYVWISHQLSQKYKIDFDDFISGQPNLHTLKSDLISVLEKEEENKTLFFLKEMMAIKKNYIDHNFFKAIKENSRLICFHLNIIKKEIDTRLRYDFKNNYIKLIYLINIEYFHYSKLSYKEAINRTNRIKAIYEEIYFHKKNLKKYLDDKNFTDWAYSYLNKKNKEWREIHISQKIDYPKTNSQEEYKNIIISFFDIKYYHRKSEYENSLNSLKKAWQQKCFRDKGGIKKLYHLPLTKQAKSELEKLSSLRNQSENKVIEDLIHQMYLKEMCDENGKPLY